MGVPGFFKWLTERYPMVVVDAIEEVEEVGDDDDDDDESRINRSKPANPNKMEFDNLYLDLNGIISPASSLPGDMFQNMFDYIDRIFGIVRPRKLLYMALDGVAPMAKTDQQRSRRFMSAKDASEAEMEDKRLVNEFEKAGKKLFPRKNSKVTVVTVGSVFIVQMIAALEYYIHLRLNKDPRWRSIKVILSDAYVPGEAEHKIMSYIRLQRNLPGYDANTRHCMYGLDADLIMLALVSHEVHFSILREKDNCFLCGQTGHSGAACEKKGKSNEDDGGVVEVKQPYQFLNIWTLREYLDYEFWIPNPPFEIDFERILDDFVFMCFFLGNDFLPQMPTLVTREGAINLMINVYRKEFPSMGGYLTDSGKPKLSRIEHFIQAVGSYEDKIFRKRASSYQWRADRTRHEKAQAKEREDAEPQLKPESVMKQNEAGQATEGSVLVIQSKQSETPKEKEIYMLAQKIAKGSFGTTIDAANDEDRISLIVKMIENENELGEKLGDLLQEKWDPFNPVNLEANKVKLGESGWKERYYKEKFSASSPAEIETIQKDVVRRYTEGLCWLLRYYYEGLCSWQWFYPYHYAPFASDLKDLGQLKISFELGVPWKPLDQLMGVLPVASSHALPEHYRKLMTDPDSPIIDFYPTDFEVDMEGKWYRNQGVVKIPFIDEGRLLAETRKVEHTLTEEEIVRNTVTVDVIFVARSHPLSSSIVSVHDQFIQLLEKDPSVIKERLDPKASDGMNGYLSPFCGDHCPTIFKSPFAEMEDITSNQVICAIYRLPDEHKHITQPSAGVIFPKKTVTERDLKPPPVLWYEDTRKKPRERRQYFTNMSHHDSSRPHPSLFPGGKEMQNPPTTSARPQLGEVARQFIVQSMQQVEKEDIGMNQTHKPPFNAAGTSNASPQSNVEHHNQEVHLTPVSPGVGSHAYNSKLVHNTNNTFQNRSVHGYRDPDASSSSAAHCSPQYERNNWRATRRSDDPNPMSLDGHRSGLLHNAGSQYPPRNTENTPIASRADSYPRGGYNDYGRYSQAHRASDHHQRGGTCDQTTSPNDLGRGYGHPQQLGNQRHSDLDRNASRRPYQPPHMRDRY